jgi:hypothetical protein
MNFLHTAIALFILCSQSSFTVAEEITPLPVVMNDTAQHSISLDEAVKQVSENKKLKVLAAKTEVEHEVKLHVIKVLTAKGHIQYLRIDATTGEEVEKEKEKK